MNFQDWARMHFHIQSQTNSATRVCPLIDDRFKKYRAVCQHQLFLRHVYDPVPNKQVANSVNKWHLLKHGLPL